MLFKNFEGVFFLKKVLFFSFVCLTLIGLTGCDNDKNDALVDDKYQNVGFTPNDTKNRNNNGMNDNGMINNGANWNNATTMDNNDHDLAQKCANIAARQKNVEGAQAYVTGNTVFVTLRVDDNVNDQKVIRNVRSALKESTSGKNFNIMSDYGSFKQMKKSTKGVTNNKNDNDRVTNPTNTPNTPGPTAPTNRVIPSSTNNLPLAP